MRSFWGIIPRYIIRNKKRVIFMGIGIVLSVALIVSLSIARDSVTKAAYEGIIEDSGGIYDIRFQTRDYAKPEDLKSDPWIEKVSTVSTLGTYKVPNSKITIDLKAYDENITEFLSFKLIEGKYPEKENEIALEQWVLEAFPQKYKIGDTIRFPHTIEYVTLEGQQLPEETESEFILVGTFQHTDNEFSDKNTAKAYITKEFLQTKIKNSNIDYSGYLMVNPQYSIEDVLKHLGGSKFYSKVSFIENHTKTFTLESVKIFNKIFNVLFIIIGTVASIIIFNVFNVSITERTKEFGMLRAIGASPFRLKAIVIGEGVILGAIFIPIGMILGNLAVKFTMMIFSESRDFNGLFNIPKEGITAALVVGFMAIILGVYFPAVKASRISPVEAISSNNNLTLKGTKLKTSLEAKGLLRKRFKFTTNMAYVNINRNKKKFITTVVSLAITIIMLNSVNYLVNCVDPITSFKKRFPGDFTLTSRFITSKDYGVTEKDIENLASINGIDKILGEKNIDSSVYVPEESITPKGMEYLEIRASKDDRVRKMFSKKQYFFNTDVLGYNPQELEKLKAGIIEGNIDSKGMDEGKKVIVAQNLNYNDYTNIKVGHRVKITYPIYNEVGKQINEKKEEFEVGAVIKGDMLKSVDGMASVMFIVSNNAMSNYLNNENYQQVNITLNKYVDYKQVERQIKETVKLSREVTLKSFKEELRAVKDRNMKLSMTLYSFVFVIAVISIINLINIIYMSVMLRSKEIGMMRALGFSSDEVKTMIKQEGIFYGIAASIVGTTLGVLLTYIIFITGRNTLTQGMTWKFPVLEVLIIFVVTTFITLMAAVIPTKSLFTTNIVDSIRGIE